MRPQPPQRVLVLCCPELCSPEAGGREARGGEGRGGEGRGRSAATPDRGAARVFEQVIALLAGFCPAVEAVEPGVCAFGARGPARYFGGETVLAGKVIAAVADVGVEGRIGVADGLFAALLAARAPAGRAAPARAGAAGRAAAAAGPPAVIVAPGRTPAFLAPHPVSVLGSPELADLLPRLGIWTLGDFAGLPAAEAANRFGAAGARAHRLARGLDPRPLTPRPPSADLSVQVDFDPPAGQSEPVVFAAKALAEQLHSGLAARGLACVRVQVQAACADGRDITRFWRHDGLLSALAVAERVRWQLDGWRAGQDARRDDPATGKPDEISLAGGITRLRMIPDQLVRDEGRQLGLWGDAVISDRVARAATRVQAMLGHEAVMRPVLAGGRDPAEQVTLVPFGDSRAPLLPAGRPWPGRIPAPAPATVYSVPRPARVTDDSGDAVSVTGRAVVSAAPAQLSADGGPWLTVTAWAGPWPVSERWWATATARRRARFQLVTEDGNAWLAAVQEGRWLIEASYD
jgi:protein ImuB